MPVFPVSLMGVSLMFSHEFNRFTKSYYCLVDLTFIALLFPRGEDVRVDSKKNGARYLPNLT